MALLQQKDEETLRNLFAKELKDPVKLSYFTQHQSPLTVPGHECQYCQEQRQILEELTALSGQLELEVHDFVSEEELAKQHGIQQIPAVELTGKGKGRMRFIGITAGYEFSTLVEDIIDQSKGVTKLSQATRDALASLKKPVHIQVFVTPT